MSPLTFLILIACLKHVKVSELNFESENTEHLDVDEELEELIEDGYHEYDIDEVEHEVKYMSIRIFTKLEFRIALKDKRRFWTNGIVPYVISKKYDLNQKKVILEGMEAFKDRTCIRFTPRINEAAFIFIEPGFGCSATVGKVSKNFVKVSAGCYTKGIVIHELMHVLGFLHEQGRPDRDEFVTINYDNVKEKQRKNFDKYPKNIVQDGNVSYDYDSIMHYGPFTFAKNKSVPTIIPKQKGVAIGQRRDFSKKDIEKINIFYNCNKQGRRRVKRNDIESFIYGYSTLKPSTAPVVEKYPITSRNRPGLLIANGRRVNSGQIGRRVKRHDDERFGPSYFPEPPGRAAPVAMQPPIRPVAFPTNARKPFYEPAGMDFEQPNYAPVQNPTAVLHPPIPPYHPPAAYPNPAAQPPADYELPAYSSVQQPHEQPKVTHLSAHPSLYAPALPRRLNHSSVEYRGHNYYASYPRVDPHRPSYITPGYERVRYPQVERPRPVYPRPSYTTAGYRRPFYPPPAYPKIKSPVAYPPVINPYIGMYYDTTPVMTEVTIIQDLTTDDGSTVQTTTIADTTTAAITSTVSETTTVAVTTTVVPTTTTMVPTTTTMVPTTTTMVPTTTTLVPTTTTMVPTTTTVIPTTTTMAPTTTTVIPTTTTMAPTTTTVVPTTTTMVPTTTQAQTTTTTVTETTTIVPTEFSSLSPLNTERVYYEGDSEFIYGDNFGYHRIRIFPDIESRTALKDPTALWTRGIVPYEFSDHYDGQQKGFLLEAMQEFHNKTCVRFVPRRNQASYIFIEPEERCSAPIGRVPGGPSRVLISEGCYLQGTIIHELMHILGFVHEQNRPDRDQYIIVMWDNIIPEGKKNFKKYNWDEVQDFGVGYDYESVMHYSSTEFGKDPNRPTLVPLQPGITLGQREGFSRKDLAKVNRLYNCRSEQAKEVVTSSPVEEFKKYFQSNVQRLFRSLLRAIANFKPSKPKNT